MAFRLPFTDANGVTDGEKARVSYLESLLSDADNLRRKFEPDWYTNILYLAGNQWEQAHNDVRQYGRVVKKLPDTKVKVTINRIYPLVRQAVSAISQNIAEQIAIPSTNEEVDRLAAELATDFLRSRLYEDEEEEVRLQELLWCMCCGTVLRETIYDPDKEGVGLDGSKQQGLGDISTKMINPFKFHLSPWSEGTKHDWVIISDVRDIAEVKELYGRSVEPEDVADAVNMEDKLRVNIMEDRSGGVSKRKNSVLLKRLFAKPDKNNPKGKMFVWANGKVLQEDTLPDGVMPFTVMKWFDRPGCPYAMPFISPLRDAQRESNISFSQLIELKNRQLRGDLAIVGMGDVVQEVNKETGQKIIRMPMETAQGNWKFVEYNLNTSEAEVMLERLWNEAMNMSGIHETSLGTRQNSATTATATAMLKESDMSGLSLFRAGFDLAHCKIAQLKLLCAKNHYKAPRMVKIIGENSDVKAIAFFGSDLRNTQDVRPRNTPILTQTMILQIKNDLNALQAYNWTGTPQEKLSKVNALLNSGLPGIREEVEAMLSPMTIDEFRRFCGELNKTELMLSALNQQVVMQQLMAQLAATQQPPEPEPDMEGSEKVPIGMGAPPGMQDTNPESVAKIAMLHKA